MAMLCCIRAGCYQRGRIKSSAVSGECIGSGISVRCISGNIGVTTSQQMLEQELLVAPKLNVYNYIMESFKNRFCLEVWS